LERRIKSIFLYKESVNNLEDWCASYISPLRTTHCVIIEKWDVRFVRLEIICMFVQDSFFFQFLRTAHCTFRRWCSNGLVKNRHESIGVKMGDEENRRVFCSWNTVYRLNNHITLCRYQNYLDQTVVAASKWRTTGL